MYTASLILIMSSGKEKIQNKYPENILHWCLLFQHTVNPNSLSCKIESTKHIFKVLCCLVEIKLFTNTAGQSNFRKGVWYTRTSNGFKQRRFFNKMIICRSEGYLKEGLKKKRMEVTFFTLLYLFSLINTYVLCITKQA